MAYITCKQCGCQMSDKSEACPVCGAPVAENLETPSPTSKEEHISASKKKNSYWIIIGIIVVALIAFAIVFILGRNDKDQTDKGQITQQEPIEHKNIPEEHKASLYHFVGTIADVGVHMSMIKDGTSVKGKYYYNSQGKKESTSIIVYGRNYDNKLELTEYVKEKTTGVFEGNWEGAVYKGTFTRQKDGKKYSFYLVETNGGIGFYNEEELEIY